MLLERDNAQRESQRALEQKELADKNFARVRQAVKDYFVQISQNKLLYQPGMESLRIELLQLARKYYQELLEQRGDDPTLRYEVAGTYFNVARITEQAGSKADVLENYRTVSTILEPLVRAYPLPCEKPEQTQFHIDLANTYNNIGVLLYQKGQPAEALRSFQQARERREQLFLAVPTDPHMRNYLAQSYSSIARRAKHHGSSRPGAGAPWTRAANSRRSLSATIPRTRGLGRLQYTLAGFCNNISSCQLAIGKPADAARSAQRACEIAEEMVRTQPRNMQFQYRLGRLSPSIAPSC